MSASQVEWYLFIVPLVTIPTLVFWTMFFKFMVPKWFKSLEEK